jgi:hypothetical protein
MKKTSFKKLLFIVLVFLLSASGDAIAQKPIKSFVYFELERNRIRDTSFLNRDKIIGAQLKYMWRELEPSKNQYAIELIRKDLDFLNSKGKELFIQLQDVNFDTVLVKPVPDYIIDDKEFHGGINTKYETNGNDEIIKQDGYVARRWDKNVAERFFKLLKVLGEHFDGKIEGVNLPETAIGFSGSAKLYPEGFTPEIYRDATAEYMKQAKKAFPKSVVIQYANFMPGEWLPEDNKSYLESLFKVAKDNGIGMGGPDIQIYSGSQMNHSYKFLKMYSNDIITGVAVQDGNYEVLNPKTNKRVTVKEIYDFAQNYLGLDYIFWCTQEPYYTNEVLPFLKEYTIH